MKQTFKAVLMLFLMVLLSVAPRVSVAEEVGESERAVLARIAHELELVEALVDKAATRAPRGARVWLDYAVLRDELRRVKGGINEYIHGPRLQPQEFEPVQADYVKSQLNEE